jgi:hypothetical protein
VPRRSGLSAPRYRSHPRMRQLSGQLPAQLRQPATPVRHTVRIRPVRNACTAAQGPRDLTEEKVPTATCGIPRTFTAVPILQSVKE